MTDHNTPKYLHALHELADRYNQRIHSSIQNGPRRREQLQCRGSLGKVVQTHSPVEPLQISIGGFHQNHQVAEEGEEMRRVRFQECQGGVDTSQARPSILKKRKLI